MAGLAKKAIKFAGKIATPLSAIGIASDLLKGKKKDAPAAAAVTPTDPRQTVMPTADDEEVRKAKKRSLLEQMRRSGRMSTILTDGGDKLGG